MVESTMLLSVCMPHSGHDEEDYIKALETVWDTLTKSREGGATDLFICGDLNIEFTLGNANEDLHGFDGIDWYGMFGPECKEVARTQSPIRKIALVTTIERL